MQRTTTRIGLGVAGAVTFTLSIAPLAHAIDEDGENLTPAVTMQQPSPFLDLLYAAPYKSLHIGDTTTVVIAQSTPAAYSLVSYMSTGAKCFAPYDAPAADHAKSGTEADADLIVRTIVSSGVDADDDGIDDHYAGTYDEHGVAACKIKATDEFGNTDWKYIYIDLGQPKVPDAADFVGESVTITPTTITATTTPTSTTSATAAHTSPTASVAGVSVNNTATLPRTGTSAWLPAALGVLLAAAGAAMVMVSRRRLGPEPPHVFEI